MMSKRIGLKTVWALAAVGLSCAISGEKTESSEKRAVSFDEVTADGLPAGWKADATNPKGKLAEWKVIRDPKAPSPPNALSIVKINDTSGGVFNLFWMREIRFQNGAIEAKVRADSGEEDQGGGLIWRAKDADNYYIARYNPLEKNFRIYYVKESRRKELASASGLKIKAGAWFTIRIVHRNEKIEGWLDGQKLLEVTDKTFPEAGGIGFWTKADAASSFDDLVVEEDGKN